jgi:hypothetical protein
MFPFLGQAHRRRIKKYHEFKLTFAANWPDDRCGSVGASKESGTSRTQRCLKRCSVGAVRFGEIAAQEKIGMSGRERFEDLASDPHLVDVMQRAHDKACAILELGRSHDDAATGIVLAKIIELAEAGETDADRLCCKALMEISDQMG